MKNLILVAVFLLMIVACRRGETIHHGSGYIYNSLDSTPFKNTQFKLWKGHDNGSTTDKEYFFSTDSKGFFSYTTDGTYGSGIAWPSYFKGAGYVGPPLMGGGNGGVTSRTTSVRDGHDIIKTTTYNNDTLFTTPYY